VDHKEQHHLHHQKEREHEKREEKLREQQQEKKLLPVHPAWLFGIGAVLVLAAVLVWTFFLQ
jgi:hypothetical protein